MPGLIFVASLGLYSMLQLYVTEDKLQCGLPEEVTACKEECDETLSELCVLLMAGNVWAPPTGAQTFPPSATELYSLLRNQKL